MFYVIQLRERGPYVYKQATQEINVNFSGKTRSSKRWKKQAKFFKEESCKDCEEDDQVFTESQTAIINLSNRNVEKNVQVLA